MSEFRQDRTNGHWSIIEPQRGERPHAWDESANKPEERAAYDPSCPFCPGNEAMLLPIIYEAPSDTSPGWRVRVVPNKYPVLSVETGPPPDPLATGYGHHEVIVETPLHDADLPDLSTEDIRAVIETWQRRSAAALALPGIEAVQLFRNHGKAAGASQGHSHSQLIALPFVPPRQQSALSWAREQYGEGCAVCAELARELDSGERIVEVTDRFALLVPFAAASPFEQWIVPRRHRRCFTQAGEEELADLAPLLQRALRRLSEAADDPAWNLIVEAGSAKASDEAVAHWSMRIVPDLTIAGGFELGSAIAVNPSSPEADARRLRDI